MNRAAFYASVRSSTSGVFGTSLSSSQVEGIEAILDEAERRGTPLRHLAYILATPYLETGGKMQPIRENLNYSVDGLLKTFGRQLKCSFRSATASSNGTSIRSSSW